MRTDRKATFASIAFAAVLAVAPAHAEEQRAMAEGRSSATVVEPLRAVVRQDLSFGMLTIRPTGEGTVRVPPGADAATYAGAALPLCSAGGNCAPHPAEIEVRGEPDRTYRVQLPGAALARGVRSGQTLQVGDLSMRSRNRPGATSGGLLDNEGADLLHVGGLLSVPTGTRADIFRADLTIAVAYE